MRTRIIYVPQMTIFNFNWILYRYEMVLTDYRERLTIVVSRSTTHA